MTPDQRSAAPAAGAADRKAERTATEAYTLPDAPPPEEDSPAGQAPPSASDEDAPPVATTGSEATSTVRQGTDLATGEAREHRGDTLDGSEGSASGGRATP